MFRFILTIIAAILISTSTANAVQRGITNIEISHNAGELLVTAEYKGGFTPEIKQEIISGVSRELFYYIVLQSVLPKWFDVEKLSETIKYNLKYDILKKQYLVTRTVGSAREEQVFDSYDEMVEWVSKIDKISLIPLNSLNKRYKYYVSIKAEIKAGELPFLLRYLLFFFPYSKFSTDWAHSTEFMLKDLR